MSAGTEDGEQPPHSGQQAGPPPVESPPEENADSSRLTRIIAVIGAVTGIFGALIGGLNYVNARRVDLRLSQVAYTPIQPRLHQPIAVGIVNRGQRATSVTKGEIWLDGVRRGTVDRLLLDSRLLDQPHSLRELRRVSSPLPADLPAGRSFAAAVIWDFTGPDSGDIWDRTFRQLSGTTLRRHNVELRLKLDPGGWRSVTVPLVPPTGTESDVFRVRDGWYIQLGLRKRRVSAVRVTSDFDDPAVVDLRVWRVPEQTPALTLSHPIAGRYNTIPIGSLQPGRYGFAVMSAGQVVAAANFVTPCRAASRNDTVINVDACYLP